MIFEWDAAKNQQNQRKHNVSFESAQEAFADPNRIIHIDHTHSQDERRMFCLGKVGKKIMTVRFTMRSGNIRIIGAGYWRKGAKNYEQEQQ